MKITDEMSSSDNRLEVCIWNIDVAHLEVEHPTDLSDRFTSTGNCTIKWKQYRMRGLCLFHLNFK